MSSTALDTVLKAFTEANITVSDFIHDLLLNQRPAHQHHILGTVRDTAVILDSLLLHPTARDIVRTWACTTSTEIYSSELLQLVKRANGFHFQVSHANAAQIETFSIPEMARRMELLAPGLWELVLGLMSLNADPLGRDRRVQSNVLNEEETRSQGTPRDEDDSDTLYWVDDADGDGSVGGAEEEFVDRASKRRRKAAQRRKSLLQIVRVGECHRGCLSLTGSV
jgi:hypothetical protein